VELAPAALARERRRVETWWAIRDAAWALFGQRPFEQVAVEEIAAAAGVSRMTFFNYFASKEAVVRDAAPGERESWQHVFDRPPDEPVWDSLIALVMDQVGPLQSRLVELKRIHELSPRLTLLHAEHGSPFYEDLRSFVRSRTPAGGELVADLTLNVFLAAADTAYAHWSPPTPFATYLAQAMACLDLVAAGLAPRRAAPTVEA
jgi:AcrR family transcriptional regulator